MRYTVYNISTEEALFALDISSDKLEAAVAEYEKSGMAVTEFQVTEQWAMPKISHETKQGYNSATAEEQAAYELQLRLNLNPDFINIPELITEQSSEQLNALLPDVKVTFIVNAGIDDNKRTYMKINDTLWRMI